MSNRDKFLKFAEACRSLAADGDVTVHRRTLAEMSQAWTKLADEEERIADLIREVDTLFAVPKETIGEILRKSASH